MSFADELAAMTACEIRVGVLGGQFSALEVARAALERIEEQDGKLGAFLELTAERALQAARSVDEAVFAGRAEELGPLAGVPVAFKDNLNMAGAHTTCGSAALKDHVARESAPCVQRILDAGGIPLGKLNMDEFAFGSSTETSCFAVTRNPWDLGRVPGGSSGGSAAAVAAGLATIALGSDAGGSIRQPACLCGVVGVKPSYGLVPSLGVEAFVDGLDQVGPFARSVEDAALALDVMAGRQEAGCGHGLGHGFFGAAREGVFGMKVGLLPAFMDSPGLSEEMRAAVLLAAKALAERGAHVLELDIPGLCRAMDAYRVLGPCRAFENLAHLDLARYGCGGAPDALLECGPEARRRVILGGYLLSTDAGASYVRAARRASDRIVEDYRRAFEGLDIILAPVTLRTAFKFGEVTDPTEMHLSDMFTVSANLAGIPAMSMPAGLGAQTGLPVGVQIIAARFADAKMLRVATVLEHAFGRASVAPAFAGGA